MTPRQTRRAGPPPAVHHQFLNEISKHCGNFMGTVHADLACRQEIAAKPFAKVTAASYECGDGTTGSV